MYGKIRFVILIGLLLMLLAAPMTVMGQEATSEPEPVPTAVAPVPDPGDPGVVIVEPEVPRILEYAIIGLMVTVIGLGFINGASAPKWALQIAYSVAANAALLTPTEDDDNFFESLMRARGYVKDVEDSGVVIYRLNKQN